MEESPRDGELWIDGELKQVLLLMPPASAWLCIGFGREEDVGKVPLHLPDDMPDMMKVRMN